MSSAEVDYISASYSCREVVWVRFILHHLGFPQRQATPIYDTTQPASRCRRIRCSTARPNTSISTTYHFVRERTENGDVRLVWVPTGDMIADLLTKALPTAVFEKLRDRMFDFREVSSGAQ